MTELDQARAVIDEIDREIAALFTKRFEAVRTIIAYKIEHDLPVYVPGREAEIIAANTRRITDEKVREHFHEVYLAILRESKLYQQEIARGKGIQ